MIRRDLEPILKAAAATSPALAVTGPRQSGKTTLVREVFPGHAYLNLERADLADLAVSDPVGFFATNPGPLVLDEIQNTPGLWGTLQARIDEDPSPGKYILTGSHSLALVRGISQSLAGRVLSYILHPLTCSELSGADKLPDWRRTMLRGFWPRLVDGRIPAGDWIESYVSAYVERDLRQIAQIHNLRGFRRFLRLLASRTGQELNKSSLATDAGVDSKTVEHWISILEASHLILLLPPYHRNFGKRLVKSPKLHFLDPGLATSLLGIPDADRLWADPARGALFESMVVADLQKTIDHRRIPIRLHHFRDNNGLESDLLLDTPSGPACVEIKSAETVRGEMLDGVRRMRSALGGEVARSFLVHAGSEPQERDGCRVVPWHRAWTILEELFPDPEAHPE